MITKLSGKRYKFEIRAENTEPYSAFSIRAISKDTRRYSSINNLNTMLSELAIEVNNPSFADSQWTLTKQEANRLSEITRELLSSPSFLGYLENKLDEDRQAGEWENREGSDN